MRSNQFDDPSLIEVTRRMYRERLDAERLGEQPEEPLSAETVRARLEVARRALQAARRDYEDVCLQHPDHDALEVRVARARLTEAQEVKDHRAAAWRAWTRAS